MSDAKRFLIFFLMAGLLIGCQAPAAMPVVGAAPVQPTAVPAPATPVPTVVPPQPTAAPAVPTGVPVQPTVGVTVPAVAVAQPTAVVAPPVAETSVVPALPSVKVADATASGLSAVPRVAPQELQAWLDAGEKVLVVDVRSLASYESKHVKGAVSIPVAEIERRQGELPREAKIVFYCT